jgi:hypothetical protein
MGAPGRDMLHRGHDPSAKMTWDPHHRVIIRGVMRPSARMTWDPCGTLIRVIIRGVMGSLGDMLRPLDENDVGPSG